jgi:hypothetical protein
LEAGEWGWNISFSELEGSFAAGHDHIESFGVGSRKVHISIVCMFWVSRSKLLSKHHFPLPLPNSVVKNW